MATEGYLELRFDIDEVREGISRTASEVGARTKDQQGDSMYDALRVRRRDDEEMETCARSAVRSIASRFVDMGPLVHDGNRRMTLSLHAPDFDYSQEGEASDQAMRCAVSQGAALWLETRHGDVAKVCSEDAKAMLDALARMVKTRKRPTRR